MPHDDEIEVRLWLYPLMVTYNLISTFVYNASTLNYLQIENLEPRKRVMYAYYLGRRHAQSQIKHIVDYIRQRYQESE